MTTNNDFCDKNEEKPNDYVKKSHNEQYLTEQWKKGELPTGIYYIIDYEDLEVIDEYVNGFGFVKFEPKEVLAPVPSYEEYDVMNYRSSRFSVRHFEAENQRLKSLLKECSRQLYEYSDVCLQEGYEIEREEVLKLKTKIDEALK